MPKILQMVNYSALQIGAVFALGPLMRFILPFAFVKRVKLNKKVFHLALLSILFGSILFYFTIENFYLFIIPNLIVGGATGLVLPYIETYAMESLGKKRFGKSRLFGSLGFITLSVVLARELDDYIVGLNFYLAFTLIMIFFGFLLTYNNEYFKQEIATKKSEKFELKKVTFLWLSLLFMQISFGAFYNFFTLYETERGVSMETISYLWIFSVIFEMLFFYFQGPLLKLNLIKVLKVSVLITVVRWLLLFMFPEFLAISFLSQSLHAVSFALHHTVALTLLYGVYQNRRLAAQFYYGFSFGLGGFIGALLAGIFYGEYLYLYAACMAFISFLILYKINPFLFNHNS